MSAAQRGGQHHPNPEATGPGQPVAVLYQGGRFGSAAAATTLTAADPRQHRAGTRSSCVVELQGAAGPSPGRQAGPGDGGAPARVASCLPCSPQRPCRGMGDAEEAGGGLGTAGPGNARGRDEDKVLRFLLCLLHRIDGENGRFVFWMITLV
ncbi:hypothetical protein AAY473_016895 [Plecturocebus cupreus]